MEMIPLVVDKNDKDGNYCRSADAKLFVNDEPIARTLTCKCGGGQEVHHNDMVCVAMRGRNPENPGDRTKGCPTEQRLEMKTDGCINTLTTVQKDNLVLEKKNIIYDDYNSNIPENQECIGTITPTCGSPTMRNGKKIIEEIQSVEIKQATKDGSIPCKIGGCFDNSFPSSKTRRGRVQGNRDIVPTLTAGSSENINYIEPVNGFYKQAIETAENGNAKPGDVIDAFNKKVLKDGISPTITTRPEGKKTAILPCVEPHIQKVGQISNEGSQCGTVVSDEGLYPTISAGCHGYANPHIATQYRIRKLTPKECWRLMGYKDEDFEKAKAAGVSNSQLYKQAGNAIVKQVLMAIFSQMIPNKRTI